MRISLRLDFFDFIPFLCIHMYQSIIHRNQLLSSIGVPIDFLVDKIFCIPAINNISSTSKADDL
uniref:Uncharacterized protein n=1 Tax=Arundo donax TaxID=35708 RepID=A0A0A9EE88_ARUDO